MLIDTSAWIEYYRPLPTQSQARHRNLLFKDLIDDHLDQDELVYTSPTIVQELLQGTKTDTDWRRILRDIDTMVFLWLDDQMTMAKEAANIYRICRKEGVTVRKSPDCLIAQELFNMIYLCCTMTAILTILLKSFLLRLLIFHHNTGIIGE